MAGDEFALVVVGDTGWAWDLDAVVAAVAATWPHGYRSPSPEPCRWG